MSIAASFLGQFVAARKLISEIRTSMTGKPANAPFRNGARLSEVSDALSTLGAAAPNGPSTPPSAANIITNDDACEYITTVSNWIKKTFRSSDFWREIVRSVYSNDDDSAAVLGRAVSRAVGMAAYSEKQAGPEPCVMTAAARFLKDASGTRAIGSMPASYKLKQNPGAPSRWLSDSSTISAATLYGTSALGAAVNGLSTVSVLAVNQPFVGSGSADSSHSVTIDIARENVVAFPSGTEITLTVRGQTIVGASSTVSVGGVEFAVWQFSLLASGNAQITLGGPGMVDTDSAAPTPALVPRVMITAIPLVNTLIRDNSYNLNGILYTEDQIANLTIADAAAAGLGPSAASLLASFFDSAGGRATQKALLDCDPQQYALFVNYFNTNYKTTLPSDPHMASWFRNGPFPNAGSFSTWCIQLVSFLAATQLSAAYSPDVSAAFAQEQYA